MRDVYQSDRRADERLDPSLSLTDFLLDYDNPQHNVIGALYDAVVDKQFDGDLDALYDAAQGTGPVSDNLFSKQAYVSREELVERTGLDEQTLYGKAGAVEQLIDANLVVNASYISPSTSAASDGKDKYGFRWRRFGKLPFASVAQVDMMANRRDDHVLDAYELVRGAETADSVEWIDGLGVSKTYLEDVFDWENADLHMSRPTTTDLFTRTPIVPADDERIQEHVETHFGYEPESYKEARKTGREDVYYRTKDSIYANILEEYLSAVSDR